MGPPTVLHDGRVELVSVPRHDQRGGERLLLDLGDLDACPFLPRCILDDGT
jgi:hypothetical protein